MFVEIFQTSFEFGRVAAEMSEDSFCVSFVSGDEIEDALPINLRDVFALTCFRLAAVKSLVFVGSVFFLGFELLSLLLRLWNLYLTFGCFYLFRALLIILGGIYFLGSRSHFWWIWGGGSQRGRCLHRTIFIVDQYIAVRGFLIIHPDSLGVAVRGSTRAFVQNSHEVILMGQEKVEVVL